MKIGIDCRLWSETGVGRYIRNLVKQLLIIDKKNNYTLFVLGKNEKEILKQVQNDNVRLVKADIKWHTVAEQLKFPSVLNRENLDLVHFPYFSVPIFYNKPFVVTIHDLIVNHFSTGKASKLPMPLYRLRRFGYKKVLKNAVSKAKKIITPSLFVKNDLIETLKVPANKIVVTQEGFDMNIKTGEVSENILKLTKSPYFLYVGNAFPHKNLEMLINGFNRINSKAKLILVGKEDYFYKRLEEKKNENLIFLHNISDSDLYHLYSNSLAVVSSSLMEGFGLIALEALGTREIPVVSDIPAFKEVCGDAAIYFDPGNAQDIERKLKQVLILKDSEKEEMREKGKIVLEKFSWQKMAKETLVIYENSINTS